MDRTGNELALALPVAYAFLAAETGPAILHQALASYGVEEYPGAADNPIIMGWRDSLIEAYPGLTWIDEVIKGDVTPWCGLFMAHITRCAGYGAPHPTFLAARSWADWGHEVAGDPELGDVLVFWRGKRDGRAGHVGLYVGEDETHYHVLGGNQADSVSITRIAKSRLLTARNPPRVPGTGYGQPRRIHMRPEAAIITDNEA